MSKVEDNILWVIWIRILIRHDWAQFGWFNRFVYTFNAIAMPILGVLVLAASILELAN